MENDIANLNIANGEEEAWQVHLEEDVAKGELQFYLVGSFLTASEESLLSISYLREKRYLFRFNYEIDVDRVVDGDNS
ncbi:hypothetical protein Godav_019107 [Gossypium davidsonii]|uniref:Uncharacterized protein n=1 Tax=Gossypium davidsonii TaxID=34287 RepID=A0A7J8QYU8_GOSDV|nr:hypothetical protein [Gossypium davidsonii]